MFPGLVESACLSLECCGRLSRWILSYSIDVRIPRAECRRWRLWKISRYSKGFSAWSEILGDPIAVAAMVDRLVHHVEIIVLKGDGYRLKEKHEEVTAAEDTRYNAQISTGANRAVFDRR
jgi:hypothetical protein